MDSSRMTSSEKLTKSEMTKPKMTNTKPTTHNERRMENDVRIFSIAVMGFYSPTIFFSEDPKMMYWVLPAIVPSFCPQRKGQSS